MYYLEGVGRVEVKNLQKTKQVVHHINQNVKTQDDHNRHGRHGRHVHPLGILSRDKKVPIPLTSIYALCTKLVVFVVETFRVMYILF